MSIKFLIVFTPLLITACSQQSVHDPRKEMKLQQWQRDTQTMENQLLKALHPKRKPENSRDDQVNTPEDILSALRKSCEISGACRQTKQLHQIKKNTRLPAYNTLDGLRNSHFFLKHKGMMMPPEPE